MTGRFEFARATGAEKAKGEGRLLLPAIDGAEVPGGCLQVHLGPKKIGGQYARIELERDGRPHRFLQALFNDGPYPGQNWIEVFDLDLPPDVDGNPNWERRLVPYLEPLGAAIPPGGHLTLEYEKAQWRSTQNGLLAGIPPLATPLGALLFDVGSGDSFKDWYFPEGGQEGGRKLQGNKAYTEEQALEMAAKRIAELGAFLAGPDRGSAEMNARAREDATRILAALKGS
jgi:hypothetical protein